MTGAANKEKDYSIMILRTAAMLMIVGCHLATWAGIGMLTMLLNVGVEVFLLISGMLYANKTIDSPWRFLKGRWIKIAVPTTIAMVFLVVCYLIAGDFEILKAVPVYLLNLQELGFVIAGLYTPHIHGLGHLWFLMVLWICYYVLIAVKKFEKPEFWSSSRVYLFFGLLFAADIALTFCGIQLAYFLVYYIGYAMGKRKKEITVKSWTAWSAAMVLALGIRLVCNRLADGTVLYNGLVSRFSHMVLAIWLVHSVRLVRKLCPALVEKLCRSRLMLWLDRYGYFIYITHYMFLQGLFDVTAMPLGFPLQFLIFAAGTLGGAIGLHWLSGKIQNRLIKSV